MLIVTKKQMLLYQEENVRTFVSEQAKSLKQTQPEKVNDIDDVDLANLVKSLTFWAIANGVLEFVRY
jgi:hypothetical protein